MAGSTVKKFLFCHVADRDVRTVHLFFAWNKVTHHQNKNKGGLLCMFLFYFYFMVCLLDL